MTREEYLAWCRARGLAYVESDQLVEAVAGLLADRREREDTALGEASGIMAMIIMADALGGNRAAVRRWVESLTE